MSITKHGVTAEQALLEARTIANADRAILDCFALDHPLFPDGPLYFVYDWQAFVASVPGASNEVTFEPVDIQINRPDESDQASSPEISLTISNVSGGLSRMLALVRGSRESMTLTNYKYASNDPSAPVQMPPTVVDVRTAKYDETSATLSCQFGDAGNLSFPALTFKRDEYPTLSRQS